MASGFSRRMKTDKLLLEIAGKTVLARVIEATLNSDLDQVIVVYRKTQVRDIAESYGVKAVLNEYALEGQSASIRAGLLSLEKDMNGMMFIVGDQPMLDFETINILIDQFEQNQDKIIIPLYNKNKGNPTIFPISLVDELNALEGDVGGRQVINDNLDRVKYIKIDNHRAGMDMDTVEEYEKLKEEF